MIDTRFSGHPDGLRHRESSIALSPAERQTADRLLHLLVEFVDDLSGRSNLLPTKLLTRMVIKRLIEKLNERHLPDAAVKDIAGGVWAELNAINVVGSRTKTDRMPVSAAESPEHQIVADIMKRLNGRSPIIGTLWNRLLVSAGTDVNERIIAAVAEEAWPFVKSRLG